MKIILIQSHEKLGNVGDIVNVKAGYARNFLFPNEIATPATNDNIKQLSAFLKSQEIKEAKERKNMELLLKQLNKMTLKFKLQAGDDEKLFGSVTSQMIVDEISNKGYNVNRKEIIIDETIKTTGNHYVNINLGNDLQAKVKIKVSAVASK